MSTETMEITMSKLKFLFVLFSLVVLAAPARAQDREHGRGREEAGQRRDDRRTERDDDENDDDENRVENRNRNGRYDDEDDDRDEEDGSRRGIGNQGCVDSNGNNVCNVVNGSIPTSLPEMINAVLISRGQLTPSGRSWLGGSAYTPRFSKSARRAPRQVTWLDRKGAVTQMWLDTNGDGRADVVKLYQKGKLVRTVRR